MRTPRSGVTRKIKRIMMDPRHIDIREFR